MIVSPYLAAHLLSFAVWQDSAEVPELALVPLFVERTLEYYLWFDFVANASFELTGSQPEVATQNNQTSYKSVKVSNLHCNVVLTVSDAVVVNYSRLLHKLVRVVLCESSQHSFFDFRHVRMLDDHFSERSKVIRAVIRTIWVHKQVDFLHLDGSDSLADLTVLEVKFVQSEVRIDWLRTTNCSWSSVAVKLLQSVSSDRRTDTRRLSSTINVKDKRNVAVLIYLCCFLSNDLFDGLTDARWVNGFKSELFVLEMTEFLCNRFDFDRVIELISPTIHAYCCHINKLNVNWQLAYIYLHY